MRRKIDCPPLPPSLVLPAAPEPAPEDPVALVAPRPDALAPFPTLEPPPTAASPLPLLVLVLLAMGPGLVLPEETTVEPPEATLEVADWNSVSRGWTCWDCWGRG